jgi:Protein of unknown function (DUF3572)
MSDRSDDAPPAAEALTARVLQFFVADPDRLMRFFDVTGLTADTIRSAANAPGFAAAVLDYMLGDEALLQRFAAETGTQPEALLRARAGLDGRGEAPRATASVTPLRGPSNLARRFKGE